MIRKVTEPAGLGPVFVKNSGGRLETQAHLREVHHSEGKLGSRYDCNYTAWDPFPFAPHQRSGDPILNGIIAPTTTATASTRRSTTRSGGCGITTSARCACLRPALAKGIVGDGFSPESEDILPRLPRNPLPAEGGGGVLTRA